MFRYSNAFHIEIYLSDCSTIQNGYLPDPDDCSSFIQCANGVSYPQKCPTGLQWRNSLLVCDLPQNVGCTIEPGKKNSVGQCCMLSYSPGKNSYPISPFVYKNFQLENH